MSGRSEPLRGAGDCRVATVNRFKLFRGAGPGPVRTRRGQPSRTLFMPGLGAWSASRAADHRRPGPRAADPMTHAHHRRHVRHRRRLAAAGRAVSRPVQGGPRARAAGAAAGRGARSAPGRPVRSASGRHGGGARARRLGIAPAALPHCTDILPAPGDYASRASPSPSAVADLSPPRSVCRILRCR
jgi:hypothetical protein